MNQTDTPPPAAPANGELTAEFRAAVADARAAVARVVALARAAHAGGTLRDEFIVLRLADALFTLDSTDRDWAKACAPPPPRDPVTDDYAWFFENYKTLLQSYANQFVAVRDRQVVGAGPDPMTLRHDVARQHGIDPESFVVSYVD